MIRSPATVHVRGPAGEPIDGARLGLIGSGPGDTAGVAAMMGVFGRIDLEQRMDELGDGNYVVRDLPAGEYTLQATANGFDLASTELDLKRDAETTLELAPVSKTTVVVRDEAGEPIRQAAVYAQRDGDQNEMPVFCGRTKNDGKTGVDQLGAGPVKIVANHPAYGWASADAELPIEEIAVVMRSPGTLRGTVTEDRAPPEYGKYMVVAVRMPGENGEGSIPRLVAPDPKGGFELTGLQPGSYHVMAMRSVRAIRSFGSIFQMAQMQMFTGGGGSAASTSAEIRSGGVADVALDISTVPAPVDGPSAHVRGTVLVNGVPGAEMTVMTWSSGRRSAEVDESGRFDLGRVETGHLSLELYDTRDSGIAFNQSLWEKSFEIEENKDLDVLIDLSTGSLSGRVIAADGSSGGRCEIELRGTPTRAGVADVEASVQLDSASDDDGVFDFEHVPAGVYNVSAKSHTGRAGRVGVQVVAGVPAGPIELRLRRMYSVSGTVELKAFGEEVDWAWLELVPEDEASRGDDLSASARDGEFKVRRVASGRYSVTVSAMIARTGESGEEEHEWVEFTCDTVIDVRDRDVTGVVVVPARKKGDEDGR